ncbi:MAG TPA: hypothetical protein DCM62_07655 [Bacteroidales bacterium]|nr:hypothetical protein [Bacteroidales bacterium]
MTTDTNQPESTTPVEAKKCLLGKCNCTTIFNIAISVALVVLFALHFTGIGQGSCRLIGSNRADTNQVDVNANLRIAYINSATLMQDYELAIQLRAEFETERTRLTGELGRRQRSFQADVERFQREVQTGAITSTAAQARERDLMQMQQELVQLNETYTNRLMQKEVEMNQQLLDALNEFLVRFNADGNFDYVLGMAQGGGILYAAEQHDITLEVLTRLNEEFLANRAQ